MPVTRKRKAPSSSSTRATKTKKTSKGKEVTKEEVEDGGALQNCCIAVHGNLIKARTSFPKIIRENGGQFSINVNNKTTHLVTTEEDCDSENSKVREAQTLKLSIVAEEWLDECIKQGTHVDEAKYKLTPKSSTQSTGRSSRAAKRLKAKERMEIDDEEEEDDIMLNDEDENAFQQERLGLQVEVLDEHRRHLMGLVDDQSLADLVIMPKEEKPIYAHKAILLTNSVFKELIAKTDKGEGPKGHQVLRLNDIPRDMIILILQIVYTGKADPKSQQIIGLLELCERFRLTDYAQWLESSLWTVENVCVILNEAHETRNDAKFKKYMRFLEKNAEKTLQTESFRAVSPETLSIILDSNKLEIEEMDLFERLLEWADSRLPPEEENEEAIAKHRQKVLEPFFDKIRFPLIDGQELFEIEKLNIVNPSLLMEAYRLIARGATEEESPRCIPRGGSKSKWVKGQYLASIRKWLQEDSKGKGRIGKVLYDSNKKDKLSNAEFHAKCDRKGPTLVICKSTNGYVFGGVAYQDWDTTGNYKQDANAFIFSITDGKGRKPIKLKQHGRNGFIYGMYCNLSYGPTWGGGHDLYINLDNPTSSYSNLGHSYDLPSGFSQGSNSGGTYLAGSYNGWQVENMIVFEVKVNK